MKTTTGAMKFEIYEDRNLLIAAGLSRWYWRAVSRNGNVIAKSGHDYVTKRNAKRAVLRFVWLIDTLDPGYV